MYVFLYSHIHLPAASLCISPSVYLSDCLCLSYIYFSVSFCMSLYIYHYICLCVSRSLSTWVIICLLVYFGYLSVNLSGQLSVCTSAHVCLPVNLTLYVNRCTRIIDQSHRPNLREHLLYAVPTSDCSSAGHSNFVIVLPSGDFAK